MGRALLVVDVPGDHDGELVGFLAHDRVHSAAREALHRAYRVEVLADAAGTPAPRNRSGLLPSAAAALETAATS